MNLEGTKLSEISQTEKENICDLIYVGSSSDSRRNREEIMLPEMKGVR